jgi:hypothetical protein
MRTAAVAAGVAYVPGPPFHVGDGGRNTLRLSFSHLTESELEAAVERLADVIRGALAASRDEAYQTWPSRQSQTSGPDRSSGTAAGST